MVMIKEENARDARDATKDAVRRDFKCDEAESEPCAR